MSTFILNVGESCSVVGYVMDPEVAKEKAGENFIASSPEDLEALSNAQLTAIYNYATCENKSTFKSSKADNAKKAWKALEEMGTDSLKQLDGHVEVKIEAKAEEMKEVAEEEVKQAQAEMPVAPNGAAAQSPPSGPKVRKVRDSKLQRMKAAFLMMNEDGSFRQWTVKELMEKCGTSERITHVYISILRSPTDRFIMPITKDKEAGTFVYTPPQQEAQS